MNKLRLSILVLFAAMLCLAAAAPVVTDTLMRLQCDPASGSATAFFQKVTVVDSQTFTGLWEPVSWSTASTRTITYTYNGQSFTEPYAQVMAAVVALANQERNNPTGP